MSWFVGLGAAGLQEKAASLPEILDGYEGGRQIPAVSGTSIGQSLVATIRP
jgi:hypothetical protein